MLRAGSLVLLLAVAFSGCGGGGGGDVSFPTFVRNQVNASVALECAPAVEINDIEFSDVLDEDPNQFSDLLGN